MEGIKQKRLAFLEDTVNFFNSTNRCTINSVCRYFLEGKDGCAIGRHIPDKKLCQEFDSLHMTGVSNGIIFNRLPLNLQELGLNLLSSVQRLHDNSDNWDKNGLSKAGKEHYKNIKDSYC